MSNITTKITLFILISVLISACNVLKKVPVDKYLLTRNEIVINGKKNIDQKITAQLAQQPNTSFLGYKLRLNMYNLAKDNTDSIFKAKYISHPGKYARQSKFLSKKQVDRMGESFWYSGWHSFLRRTGEPPVIMDTLKAKKSIKRLKAHYFNNGYFDVTANYGVNYQKSRRSTINYTVTTGEATFLDTISRDIETPELDSLYLLSKSKTYIKEGQQYNVENFSNERSRITSYFRNHGVYHFQQQSIHFEVDTLNNRHKAPVIITVTDKIVKTGDSIKSKSYKIFRMGRVNIFTNQKAKKNKEEIADSATYKNFHIYSKNKLRYRPKAITDAVFLQKDSLYSDDNRTLTLRLLSNLQVFNYPNILFVEDTLTQTLETNIYLTSKPKFHFDANADFTRSNIQLFGITGGSGISARNVFRGAEILQIGLHGNIGSSRDPAITETQFFNISEIGADIRLTFPRLFFPFKTDKIIPKSMIPTTVISGGFAKQTNIGLDKENFTAAINYNWIPKKNAVTKFDLVNVQYIKNINVGNYFNVYKSTYNKLNDFAKLYRNTTNNLTINDNGADDFITEVLNNEYPLLVPNSPDYKSIKSIKERKDRLTENNLIFATNFGYSKDSKTDFFDKDFYSIRGKIESAGSILSLIANAANSPKNQNGNREVFNLEYSEYIKGEVDFVKNWDLSNGMTAAARAFFGIALPFGNSKSVPFARSYFAGGSNDNRAWQSYSLGPGSSGGLNDFNEANMKIALNAEFRYKIFGALNGAFFADCGNIWNVLDNETDESKIFSGISSLKDLALGTGLGIRYDFKFFLARFDFGFKTYNPAKVENQKWFKELNLSKAVLNFGINYPF